jgi:hypothetical protein
MNITETINSLLLPPFLFSIYFVIACLIVHQFNLVYSLTPLTQSSTHTITLQSSSLSPLPQSNLLETPQILSSSKELQLPEKKYKLNGHQVVFVDDLPQSIPNTIKRYRLRGKFTVRVNDLLNNL